MPTKIDYAHESINPGGWGCFGPRGTAEKPNRCEWCYAWRMAKRNLRDCPDCRAFVPHWHDEEVAKMASWRRSRRVFVQSMGDLFYPDMPLLPVMTLFQVMYGIRQHTYLILTKNPQMMRVVVEHYQRWTQAGSWPADYRHVQLGVSVTNQQDADERIPWLLKTPAAVRWLSCEPLMGPVDLGRYVGFCNCHRDYYDGDHHGRWCPAAKDSYVFDGKQLDWIVVGAETGNRKGKVTPKREWIESIVNQCQAAGVAVFMKNNLQSVWGTELIQELLRKEAESA